MKQYVGSEKEITAWSRLYERPLSEEDYNEICFNLNGFFTTLKKWHDKAKMKKGDFENDRTKEKQRFCKNSTLDN